MALENTSIEEKEIGSELKIEIEYSENEKFKYFCNINKIKIIGMKNEDKTLISDDWIYRRKR